MNHRKLKQIAAHKFKIPIIEANETLLELGMRIIIINLIGKKNK